MQVCLSRPAIVIYMLINKRHCGYDVTTFTLKKCPMWRICFFSLWVLLAPLQLSAQSTDTTLDVACWNIEWFGSPALTNGPVNKDLQEANVAKVLQWMKADLYGLVEVVDTSRLRKVVDSLGTGQFGFSVSPYCSNATQPSGNAWLTGQKLVFIWRKSVFANVTTRGMMRSSSSANTNWATGRFPFLLSATATLAGVSRNLHVILVHAKAGSTQSDHDRRRAGVQELKDTLDLYYSTASTLIIGDYNDALDKPIYTGATVTSFQPIVADSTDADHYRSITLPLARAGQTSMIGYPNVIDNHIISNELVPFFIASSPKVLTDVVQVVPDYVTAENTSDHFPVMSRFDWNGTVLTSVQALTLSEAGLRAWPNPAMRSLYVRTSEAMRDVAIRIYSVGGTEVYATTRRHWMLGETVEVPTTALPSGIYILELRTSGRRVLHRFVKD
ncbi:MAG: T9SS type A sorting domain-containing protein [Bacteroidetes bacterium]|nr:T9SS type A sorting domain-containing protein [Bacteroidota bacterium]